MVSAFLQAGEEVAPTGGSVDAGAPAMYRVRDGKIAEIWYYPTRAQSIRESPPAEVAEGSPTVAWVATVGSEPRPPGSFY